MVLINILKLNMILMVFIDGKDKYTKTKYNRDGFDRHGFDRDAKHKDTGIFLNNENINWLKNKDEFLKLYNEIIKNGEFMKVLTKQIFHHMNLKRL